MKETTLKTKVLTGG